ncbi:hypothetical protein BJY52DRAFT_173639 [Lactarius psammicola]|nr:hypothetical protein BJY52DRAFT_173639 [Lactarius psammicola]
MSVDLINQNIEMTFRSGSLSRSAQPALSLSDLQEGQKIEGHVKRSNFMAIFIEIESLDCHKIELPNNKNADTTLAQRSFREGDIVKVIVCSVILEKRRISLSMKLSCLAPSRRPIPLQTKTRDRWASSRTSRC